MNTSRPSPAPSLPVSRSTHGKRRHFRKRQAPLATEIVERLLLGNYEASEDCELLQRHHVTRVLSVLESAPDRDRIATAGIEYDNVPLADSKQADLLAVLERAVATIERWLAQGHTVLVHCRSGKSRSVAVVLAVLLHRAQQQQQQTPVVSSVAQVLAQVRARHPAALPNKSFLLQLALYHYSGCRVNALVHDGLHQWQLQLPHYQLPSTLGPEGATATDGIATSTCTAKAAGRPRQQQKRNCDLQRATHIVLFGLPKLSIYLSIYLSISIYCCVLVVVVVILVLFAFGRGRLRYDDLMYTHFWSSPTHTHTSRPARTPRARARARRENE